MVARVALANDRMVTVDSTKVHISGIQFKGHSEIDSDINIGLGNRVDISYSESEKQTVTL
jgi:hypothetical protein